MSYDEPPMFRQPQSRPLSAILAPIVLVVLIIEVIGIGVWYFWPRSAGSGLNPNAAPREVTPRGELQEDEKATIELYRQASPSVVHITRLGLQQDPFSFDVQQVPAGTGSGFIWDEDGHIVTNHHVVEGARDFQITLADHSTWNARRVGEFAEKDLAVLVTDAPKSRLKKIKVGTSADLQVGQKAFAIGNPFGLDQTLTTGIISALDRQFQAVEGRPPIKSVIQTNAAINPGNSGGPLLDSSGRLIGVNTAILSPSGANAGIGFAIPVDEVNRVVPEIIKKGKVMRPGLGIQIFRDPEMREMGLEGVMVKRVVPGGAAHKAGLRPPRRQFGQWVAGDIILAVNSQPIRSSADLFAALEKHKVGDTVTLRILREEKEQDVQVTLQSID